MERREGLPEALQICEYDNSMTFSQECKRNGKAKQNFWSNLDQLRRDETQCDVILIAKSKVGNYHLRIPAHKVVLMAASAYFMGMFTPPMKEATEKEVKIQMIEAESLLLLIHFIYTGKVNITEENVQSLLETANKIQSIEIEDACSKFLTKIMNLDNCIGFWLFADRHNISNLFYHTRNYVFRNFEKLITKDEFLSLDFKTLLSLLSNDQLGVTEEVIFQAVKNWILHDPNRDSKIPKLLPVVRFPLLELDTLFTDIKEFVKDSVEGSLVMMDGCRALLLGEGKDQQVPDKKFHWRIKRITPICNEVILLIGGQDPRPMRDVNIFDVSSSSWHTVQPLPVATSRAGAIATETFVYQVGGFTGRSRSADVYIFDYLRNEWWKGRPMKYERETLGVAWDTERACIYALGGYNGRTGLSCVERIDPRVGAWEEISKMSCLRSSVAATVVNDRLYAIGGYDGDTGRFLDTTEYLDLRMDRWVTVANMNDMRSGGSAISIDGSILVAGGHEGANVNGRCEIFNKDEIWCDYPSLNEPRRNATMVQANGIVHLMGGDNADNENLTSIEILKGLGNYWEVSESKLPKGRSLASAVVLTKISHNPPLVAQLRQF